MDLYKTGLIPLGTVHTFPDGADGAALPPPAELIAIADTSDETLTGRIATMLAACGLTADKTRIIAPSAEPIAFTRLRQTPGLRYLFLFGITPDALGIQAFLPPDSLQSFGGIHFLVTRTPESLFADPAYRGALWNNVLRPHFKPDAG
jgi:hypothetical protein